MKKQQMKLRHATLSVALGFCIASGAYAQSNVTGSIFGAGDGGSTVVIQNMDTGVSRTTTVDKNGRYRASDLPNGRYRVTLQKDGQTVGTRENVAVSIASGTEVSFSGGSVQDLGRIEVTASAAPSIDVSQVDTKTVFTAEQLNKISIARDIASVAMLAPSVVRNDSYSSGGNTVPSFGGSASSENAYYINGFAVTNPLSNIGFTSLPFDAIAQQQILTGGYGAEFGRSTGGVINVVTKRGTNEWKGGIYTMWSPEALRASPRNYYYPDTGFYGPNNPDPSKRTDGTLYQYRNKNQYWSETTGVYVSGPLIKDRLFVYADVEKTKRDGEGVASTRTAAASTKNAYQTYAYNQPKWAVKMDWNITDNHLLEFTGISDVDEYESKGYLYNYSDFTHGNVQNGGSHTKQDSRLYVGKYTGYLTDSLTVSALYGQQKITHKDNPWGYDPSCPRTSSSAASRVPGIPDANYAGCWTAGTVNLEGAQDKTDGYRLDVGYTLGAHDLRAGIDTMTAKSITGDEYGGGYIWVYSRSNNPNGAVNPGLGVVGTPAQGGGYGTNGYYVRRQYYTHEANVKTEQAAQFIEDRWQVTDNLLLSLGLRNEQFTNYTSAGDKYVKQDNQWAPRLGFSWDVFGDSSFKLFGNAGRYHLALPNNVAVRAASKSLYTMEYFTYTGVDAKGNPTGLKNITVVPNGYSCPGQPNVVSSNLECGNAPDPRTVAAIDLKSHYQDEFIVGMEQVLSNTLSWGAKLTYRQLKSAIDDTCAPALGGGCFIFNPGVGNSFWEEQDDGSYKQVYYSAKDLALPKLKRNYYALDLFLERAYANGFYGKVEYTFSRNYGNTEGQLASDLDTGSGGQTDVSATQDWDLPQLMQGANGLLPNHRAHQLKAFGFYEWTKEWRTGASLIMASGRPRNCTSFYPTPDKGLYDGAYYYFCGLPNDGPVNTGKPGYQPPSSDYGPSPRGSKGTTPWTFALNLNVAYTPAWANEKLTLQADVLNVLNRQVAGQYYSRYATDRYTADPRYGQDMSYSAPRQVRLTARYDF